MSYNPLPVLLIIPHSGFDVPSEIQGKLAIGEKDIYNDCDLWNDLIFDFEHPSLDAIKAETQTSGALDSLYMPIARTLIDVNRPPSRLGQPDGPVKTHTSYGEMIYKEPLDDATQQLLMDRYWHTYHNRVAAALEGHKGQVKLLFDCHNMAQVAPSHYYSAGTVRPHICIGNYGDAQGEPRPEIGWVGFPPGVLRKAVAIGNELFADLPLLEPMCGQELPIFSINNPFSGSFIAARHLRPEFDFTKIYKRATPQGAGATTAPSIIDPQAPIDCSFPHTLMIEINRGLFVGNQTGETAVQPPNQERIAAIRERIYRWLVEVCAMI